MNGGVPGGEFDALVLDDALPSLRSTRKTRGHVRSGDAMAATRSMSSTLIFGLPSVSP
jgi:hypothetical protein